MRLSERRKGGKTGANTSTAKGCRPQTGADRAALDWTIKNGIPHGGWRSKIVRSVRTKKWSAH
ncbi:MAG: YpsA SLOG family protein [Limisphaerales bacterium]